jgi:Fic family protein
MYFKLEKPDLSKVDEKNLIKVLFSERYKEDIIDFVKKVSEPEYLYWDHAKYKEPAPAGLEKEQLWKIVKIFREAQGIKSPIKNVKGQNFKWSKLSYFEEFFHELDMNTGGELFVRKADIDRQNKEKLISRGNMEEAIASSQLEGAATSRQVAKKMLREGRKPKNESERMIVNSYLSMRAIEEKYKKQKMSLPLLIELHKMITDGTKDGDGELPKLRTGKEDVFVVDRASGEIYHKAPDADFVKKELESLIKFANDELAVDYFVHPVIKAIMIHFWIGYLHPFTDGNGRLARLLFFWYLLKNGYWAFAYLPISKMIKKSPNQYKMAYVYSEQDDNDLTYFIDYIIRKIELAIRDFHEYLEKESLGNVKMKKAAELKYALNERQIYLLIYLSADQDERTTQKMHMNIYQVAKMTAAKDLKGLAKKGFLKPVKQGRNVFYYGTDKIKELF